MGLREDQILRYSRHVLLPDVGGAGQARLLAASVRIADAGGAGAAALLYLAAAGVGELVVTDGGTVERAGFLYESADVGRPAFEVVRERVAALNPDVRVVHSGEAPWSLVLPQVTDLVDVLDAGSRAAAALIARILAGKT